MFGDRCWSSRSLQPERLALPPTMPRRNISAPFGILVGSVVVAAMAYYFAVTSQAPQSEPAPGRQIVSLDPIALPSWFTDGQLSSPTLAHADDHTPSMQSGISLKNTTSPQLPGAPETVAMLQPDERDPANGAARVLNTEEIKLLMKQGNEFIRAGDVVAARMVFQRAAQAGEADAAMAVGATYDPIILAKLGVVGVAPDGDKARVWYQRAESLGSGEASRRLAILANR
jgi:TPR repeat protein